ncbi:cobalt/nickel transport system permease protein [Methanohalophilus levihalophilus]|uniref:cobalt ECF transporter T component CbiQ n=1 Tax=Methanohalophilus levihalophilus TaxID=1431282 RepID=UPI001AEAA7B4|nr:cobalt ECF transporter T component CbiQ [Methanohalophilus levihalophilus]MBP2030589.1 cobalt/nickel transport system permease protein [Methanohalophilus levihalophilus]
MKYPHIDLYASMESPIHRLDPRAKIIAFSTLVFSFVFLGDIRLALIGLFSSVAISMISKIPTSFVIHRIKWVFLFLFPLLFVLPLTTSGTSIFSIAGFPFTSEGLEYALLIIIRGTAAVTIVVVMLGSMRFDNTIKALYMLKVPATLVQMLMFTYRYIFVMIDEFQRMWKAITAKGFSLKTNKYGLSILGNLIGMLILKSYDRAERVYQSMVAKGYTGNPATLTTFKMEAKDYIICASLISFAILLHTYHLVPL